MSVNERELRALVRELAPLQELLQELQQRTHLPPEDIRETLERVLPLASAQAEQASAVRRQLLDTLMADLDVLDPVPRASVAQARRVAEARNRLLAAGAWTVAALADARGASKSTTRTWLARQRAANRLVTVTVRGEAYVPGLLLDEAADAYDGVDAVLRPLREAGMDAWAVWVWLDSPSPWLDGDRPADLLADGAADRAAQAARSQAANAATATATSDVA